jgi:hypothetical protein
MTAPRQYYDDGLIQLDRGDHVAALPLSVGHPG